MRRQAKFTTTRQACTDFRFRINQTAILSDMVTHCEQQIMAAIRFKDFWLTMSCLAGDTRLTMDAKADTLGEFISDQEEYFIRQLMTTVYSCSKCSSIYSHIDLRCVFDALGESGLHMRQTDSDDLLNVELLEEIAWLTTQYFPQQVQQQVIDSWTTDCLYDHSNVLPFQSRTPSIKKFQ